MLGFIWNFFGYKAKSFEDFVKFVERENCRTVTIVPYEVAKGGAETASAGVIANFHYMLMFTATTHHGRKVVYSESSLVRFGSEYGSLDAESRRNISIKAFLLAEKKLNELQAKLPNVTVSLIGPGGRPMDEAMFASLHNDAAKFGVSI